MFSAFLCKTRIQLNFTYILPIKNANEKKKQNENHSGEIGGKSGSIVWEHEVMVQIAFASIKR